MYHNPSIISFTVVCIVLFVVSNKKSVTQLSSIRKYNAGHKQPTQHTVDPFENLRHDINVF